MRTSITVLSLVLGCGGGAAEDPSGASSVGRCDVGLTDTALQQSLATVLGESAAGVLEASNANGVVVGVAAPGTRPQVQAFGYIDGDGADPMPPDAIFDIGSIQKNVRWMTLHLMVDQGKIQLDDAINDILEDPRLPGVTWRQLAMHSAGLKHWDDTPDFLSDAFARMSHTFTYDEMMAYLDDGGHGPVLDGLTAGESFWYSNYGPLLATRAAELVYGQDAVTLTQEQLFGPLALERTSHQGYEPDPDGLVDGFWANGEAHTWTDDPQDTMAFSSAAGGQFYTDACDLLHYSQALFHDEGFIRSSTLADAFSSSVPWVDYEAEGGPITVGGIYAGFQSYFDGVVGHLGSGQHGHSSMFMHDTATGVSVVILANVAADSADWDPVTGTAGAFTGDHFATPLDVMEVLHGWAP